MTFARAWGSCGALLLGLAPQPASIVYGRVNAVCDLRGLPGGDLFLMGARGYGDGTSVFRFPARIRLPIGRAAGLMLHFTDVGRKIYWGMSWLRRVPAQSLHHRLLYARGARRRGWPHSSDDAHGLRSSPHRAVQGLELQSITAAAPGGVALQGGRGTVGTILAVNPARRARKTGPTHPNVNSFWQDIAQGALLVIAVVIQGVPGPRCRAAMSATLPMKATDRIGDGLSRCLFGDAPRSGISRRRAARESTSRAWTRAGAVGHDRRPVIFITSPSDSFRARTSFAISEVMEWRKEA